GDGGFARGKSAARDLVEDLAQRLLPSPAPFHRAREIVGRERVERADREVVDVSRVGGERDRGQEGDEEPDLGPLVELATAGEVRRDLSLRKGMEEPRRVSVVPDEDREVAVPPLTAHRLVRDE